MLRTLNQVKDYCYFIKQTRKKFSQMIRHSVLLSQPMRRILFALQMNSVCMTTLLNSCLAQSGFATGNHHDDSNSNNSNRSSSNVGYGYTSKDAARLNLNPRPYSRAAQKLNQTHRGPVKDRYPPMGVDVHDPRRRLAVLIDSTNPRLLPLLKGSMPSPLVGQTL